MSVLPTKRRRISFGAESSRAKQILIGGNARIPVLPSAQKVRKESSTLAFLAVLRYNGISKLRILLVVRGFESHPHRQKTKNLLDFDSSPALGHFRLCANVMQMPACVSAFAKSNLVGIE